MTLIAMLHLTVLPTRYVQGSGEYFIESTPSLDVLVAVLQKVLNIASLSVVCDV